MNKEIKDIVLKSLEVRKNRYLKTGIKTIPRVKNNIDTWQREIDQNIQFTDDGMIRMAVYKDTNEKLIKQEKEWLAKVEPIVADCEKAIEYIKKNY
jgi:predicted KAP-like P-loop ATPase